MKMTEFRFYKNTPLTNVNNTIHFKSNKERDSFFDGSYQQFKTSNNYNFIRDRLNVRVDIDWYSMQDVNYMRMGSDFDGSQWIYAFVLDVKYINDGVSVVTFLVDPIMTWLQGDFSGDMQNITVTRQHLPSSIKKSYAPYLRTNDDTINVGQKRYSGRIDTFLFQDYVVMLQSSVKIHNVSYGSENGPKITTASGGQYDGVVGAQELYAIKYSDFSDFMNYFSEKPWVARNFSKVMIIPTGLLDLSDGHAKQFSAGGTNYWHLESSSSYPLDDNTNKIYVDKKTLYNLAGIVNENEELFREEYFSIEMTAYNGQTIKLNPALLENDELVIKSDANSGYDCEVWFYPYHYGLNVNEGDGQSRKSGSYINTGIVFKNWDTTPVLYDNGALSRASSAYSRARSNEKTNSGSWNATWKAAGEGDYGKAVGLAMSGWAGNALGVAGNAISGATSGAALGARAGGVGAIAGGVIGGGAALAGGISNMFTSDFNHFQDQNAALKDTEIQAPAVSDQNTPNAFNIKHNNFGITVKYQTIDKVAIRAAQRYHSKFGYKFDFITPVQNIESMSICNFLMGDGPVVFAGRHIPQLFNQHIQTAFKGGVTFWHNDGTPDPIHNKDVINNVEVM